MQNLMIWFTYNRGLIVSLVCAGFWIGPFAWYFRGPIRGWIQRGKPHNWSVDMVHKKAIVNGKEQLR